MDYNVWEKCSRLVIWENALDQHGLIQKKNLCIPERRN